MKKNEVLQLAPIRVKLIIEYIKSILEDTKKVSGKIEFNNAKINNEKMCTMDIYVPESNFEKHINLGITTDHCDILYEILFDEFINEFLNHPFLGVTRYREIRYTMGPSFSGVTAVNSHTLSKIEINFLTSSKNFDTIVSNYNQRVTLYQEEQNNNEINNNHHRK